MGERSVNDWERDKRWAGRFLPEVKRILGEHLIGEAPIEEDRKHNCDLIVLKLEAIRIACRIRQYKYLAEYGGEFTIRVGRPSGMKSELTKIIEGWGDFFFYGFGDEKANVLAGWHLLRLNEFRLWHAGYLQRNKGEVPGKMRANFDGTTFRVYRIADLPESVVMASGCTEETT